MTNFISFQYINNTNLADNTYYYLFFAFLLSIDGSIRLDTLLEIAIRENIVLPSYDRKELFDILYFKEDGSSSLDDCLSSFKILLMVMQTESSLQRISYELAEDAARENIIYMEVFTAIFVLFVLFMNVYVYVVCIYCMYLIISVYIHYIFCVYVYVLVCIYAR